MSTTQGSASFDGVSAAVAYAGDQCAAIEVDLDAVELVVRLAPIDSLGRGVREEHWRAWIQDGLSNPLEYFAAVFTDSATPVGLPALTPATTYPPTANMIFVPADQRPFGLRVPRDKPYLHYRWSKASPTSILRLERILPPLPPPGP